jgi:hypothetical protein
VTEGEVERSLVAILEAIEAQALVLADIVTTLKAGMSRDVELQDGIAELDTRLGHHASRARLLYSMKACTLTSKCLRCGTVFAAEPGPALCGPCWTELGRPDVYLHPVPPIGA